MSRRRTCRRLPWLVAGALAAAATLVAGFGTATAAGPPGVEPQAVTATLGPGESTTVAKTVHTPEIPPKPDIYFLADTTGSMGPAINQVKTDSVQILADIDSQTTDPRYGAGDYKDFPFDPYAFNNAAPIPAVDDNGATALAAIALWTASGGADGSEGQFFAHDQLSDHSAANWRSDSTRILVWFGDAPGHDPICTAISGHGHNITEASVTSALVAAGIKVVAISTLTGFYANGLDDNPTFDAGNYAPFCTIAGTSGQATRIANATGGVHLTNVPADEISDAILEGLSNLPVEVTPSLGPCDPRLSVSFAPTTQTVQSGEDALFDETITVSSTALAGVATCTVNWLLDGQLAGPDFTQTITITIVPGPPATLTLEPKTSVNPVDSQHCVTATVRDIAGNPVPGVTVRFSVTGSVNTSGSATTDANGQAEFCYTGPALPGADVISAYADTNNDNVQDPGEPFDTATKTWVLPVTTPGCEIKITNGGWIIAMNGDRGSFGGNAKADAEGNVSGQEEYQDHGPVDPFNLHGNVLAVVCGGDGQSASVFGQATVDGAGAHNYRINVFDDGEPGTTDRYHMIVDTGYDSGDQVLMGGNVQVRRTD